MVTDLGYKIFLMFATINIGGMATFSLYVPRLLYSPSFCSSKYARAVLTGSFRRAIPETKGRSLEEMDIIFGSVSADQRQADIARQERGGSRIYSCSRRKADADPLLPLFIALIQPSSTISTRRRPSGRSSRRSKARSTPFSPLSPSSSLLLVLDILLPTPEVRYSLCAATHRVITPDASLIPYHPTALRTPSS